MQRPFSFTGNTQVKPWSSLPRLNRAHPLARGMATFCYDHNGVIYDLINNTKATIVAPGGIGGSKIGFGQKFGLSTYAFLPPYPVGQINPFGGAAPYSAAMGTFFTGPAGTPQVAPDSALATFQAANNNEDTFFGFNIWQNGQPGNPNPYDCISAVYNNSNNGIFSQAIVPNTFQSWGVAATSSSTALHYGNGVRDTSIYNSAANAFQSTFADPTTFSGDTQAQLMYATASINAGQTFGQSFQGIIFYVAAWGGRALTDRDFFEIHFRPRAPYGIPLLIYPEDEYLSRRYRGVVAAGGGASLALTVTEAADIAAFTTAFADRCTLVTTEAADVATFAATFGDQFSLATTESADTAIFAATFGDQLSLAAAEAPDTAAFAATVADQFSLATTEAPDVLAFVGDDPTALSFAVTEAADVVAFNLGGVVSLSLATTEAPDVAAFSAGVANQLALAVTESADTATFTATVADQLALAATETPDVAAFTTTFADQFTLAVAEAPDVAAFVGDDPTTLSFAVTEAADVAAFATSVSDQFALAVTEGADVAAFSTSVSDQLSLSVSEAADTAAFTTAFVGAPVFVLVVTETPDTAAFSAAVVNPVATNTGDGGKFKKFREPPHPDWPKPGWPHVVSNPVDLFTQVDRVAESRDALRSAIRNAGKPPLKAAPLASTSIAAPAAAPPASVVASKGALAKVAAALAPAALPAAAPAALVQETAAAKEREAADEEEAIIALLLVA